jgi:hypothetical protein
LKIKVCDKCGVRGRLTKSAPGPNVAEVKAGLHNGGRVLDLCGDCRRLFSDLLNGWLEPPESARLPDVSINEEGWYILRAAGDMGGKIVVDATGEMTPGHIDIAVTSCKGPNAACAISRADALALAAELTRVAR